MQANKQQQRAIAHNTGPALILAGPGSDKTFTTVERVRYLIEVHHADPSHILVITFTKAAARQMRDRFFARMDNQFFPVTFGTFHAVFFHILKTSCHYNGSSILKEKEKREYLRAALLTLPKKFYAQNDGKADPEILYFDEPTSALDPELTGEVLAVMRQLAEEGMTMLVVTHEMGFARGVSSKTVFMENGVVVEAAPSQEFFAHPKEERTREFLRKIEHTN